VGRKARIKKYKKMRQAAEGAAPRPAAAPAVTEPVKNIIVALAVVLILAAGISLRLYHLGTVTDRSPDEKLYAYQAETISRQGIAGVKTLVMEHNMRKELWIYPPPIRVGYLLPYAALMKLARSADVKIGSYISFFSSCLSLLLLVLIGLKFFNRWAVLYAVLFMSVSPVDLAIARKSWQDAAVGCAGLVLIYMLRDNPRGGQNTAVRRFIGRGRILHTYKGVGGAYIRVMRGVDAMVFAGEGEICF
jgi:hypothetical protein